MIFVLGRVICTCNKYNSITHCMYICMYVCIYLFTKNGILVGIESFSQKKKKRSRSKLYPSLKYSFGRYQWVRIKTGLDLDINIK